MRYFHDSEFYDDGKTIELISMGIVAEDGRELYMQSCHFSPQVMSPWLVEHVLPQLTLCPHKRYQGESTVFGDHIDHGIRGQCVGQGDCFWRTRAQMQQDIVSFMDIPQYGMPELWGYYSSYDWVVFCQVFGTMMDLPQGFPKYTLDLKQWCVQLGNPTLPQQQTDEHMALADARWNKQTYDFLQGVAT